MKILGGVITILGACAVATSVNASNVADGDIVTFTANTTAKASEVNGNFTALKNAINDNNNRLAGTTFFHGDGSAGDLTISTSTNWNTTPPTNDNYNFANVTIDSGQTLTVPAGTTIRCTGTFTNNGTISVLNGAQATSNQFTGFNVSNDHYSISHPGDTPRAASGGSYHMNATTDVKTVYPGYGGLAIARAMAATSFNHFRFGGGAGGGWYTGSAGHGGGLIKIYCKGAISNPGTITSNGGTGASGSSGGGGGGIVILASVASVTVAGTINVIGGNGAASWSYGGPGGGGGGGIIIMAAPTVTTASATLNYTGGTPGATTTAVVNTSRMGGHGGGASGGNGGIGGSVPAAASATANAGASGSDGYTITLQQNPIYLMN